jgi:beta-lactamase regulating signal transducer with metallopeptidase domain
MTTLELIVPAFLRAQLAGSGAILAVLVLRAPVRRMFGAELAYRLWLLPLVAAVASLFPSLREFIAGDAAGPGAALAPVAWEWRLLAELWPVGATALAGAMIWGEVRFQRLVSQGRAGPAVMGVTWPQLVVPRDYTARFTDGERAFIREHERVHMVRSDPKTNLLIAVLQIVSWFNPLAYLAAAGARLDQELACDAVVIERHPRERRQYAEALLKAQVRDVSSPLACFLAAHPLELRFKLLAQRPVSLRRYMVGATAIAALWVAAAVLLWGLAPA